MRHSIAHHEHSGLRQGRTSKAVGGLLKRGVDVIFAALALVLLAPILAIAGIAVRLSLGTPIIVIERSVGLGGKVFGRVGFRTEPDNPASTHQWTEALTTLLRQSGIAKLPQLYNVLRGDMSLVGPQVVAAHHALHLGIKGPELLRARPGLVSVRRHTVHILRSSGAEIASERLYIMRWSLWLDVRIVFAALGGSHTTDAESPAK